MKLCFEEASAIPIRVVGIQPLYLGRMKAREGLLSLDDNLSARCHQTTMSYYQKLVRVITKPNFKCGSFNW